MRTNKSPRLTLVRGGAGEEENGSASTIFGPVRAGLTTSHRTQSHQLSVWLNELESNLDDLVFRYLEVLDTLNTVTARLVERGLFTKDTTTTEEDEC